MHILSRNEYIYKTKCMYCVIKDVYKYVKVYKDVTNSGI